MIRVKKKGGHFWHWFIGEFLFCLGNALVQGAKNLTVYNPVRQWGSFPLDKFYNEVSCDELQVVCANALPTSGEFIIMRVRKWDKSMTHWNPTIKKKIRKAVNWLRMKAYEYASLNKIDLNTSNVVRIQVRKNSAEFESYYRANQKGEKKKYGTARRQCKILNCLDTKLTPHGIESVQVSGDGDGLYQQIVPYLGAQNMVLCHGAGMAWILFMNSPRKIIEVRKNLGSWRDTVRKVTNTNGYGSVIQFDHVNNTQLVNEVIKMTR